MKNITQFLDSQPKWIYVLSFFLTVLIIIDFCGIFPDKKEKTPYDIQIRKIATIELENGSQVVLKGYNLLEGEKDFVLNDAVYIELSEKCIPSSVRHFYDAHQDNGQMYAETTWSGSYPANLIPGKIIALNY